MSRIFIVVASLAVILLSGMVRAQGGGDWRYSFNADVTYDNNIFCLSPLDIDSYRHGENPARFPYHSLDDIDVTVVGALRWRAGKVGVFRGSMKVHQLVVNQEKSYGLINCQFDPAILSGVVSLSYTWMPNYLIRYYRDPGSTGERYSACRFGEHLFGVRWTRSFGRISIAPVYRFEIDDYIPPFDYYDTRAHRVGGRLKLDLERNFIIGGDYEFKRAEAKGPLPDISYQQHTGQLNLATRPRIFNRFGVSARYSWIYRKYTVDDPLRDPAHTGRVDQTNTIGLECNYRVQRLTLVFEYQLEWREVSSPYKEKIEDIKNYRANRFSLGLRLPFARVQSNSRIEEDTGE